MYKKIAFLTLFLFSLHSKEFFSKSNKLISLEACQVEDLTECNSIFVNAFLQAYEKFTDEQLGVEDKKLFLKEAFIDVYNDFQNGGQKLFIAKHQEKIIGFVGFKETNSLNQIYITQLAVDPEYWNDNIGKQLVFFALDAFENIDSLVVISRKINDVANNFYQKLGFENSNYLHPGYSPEKYIGFEWYNDY